MTVPTTHKTFNFHNNNKKIRKKEIIFIIIPTLHISFLFVVLFTAAAAAVFIVGHIIRYMHRILFIHTSVNFKHNCKYRISYLNSF